MSLLPIYANDSPFESGARGSQGKEKEIRETPFFFFFTAFSFFPSSLLSAPVSREKGRKEEREDVNVVFALPGGSIFRKRGRLISVRVLRCCTTTKKEEVYASGILRKSTGTQHSVK